MSWSIDKSSELYGIHKWGEDFFRINSNGNVELSIEGIENRLDIYQLVQDLRTRGIRVPILLRFPNIVQKRVELINNCFNQAISEYAYKGEYLGVYPIKVNQQRHLVEEIIDFGKFNRLGLECGSKPELLIALATLETKNSLIICNGFKDQEYIETALLSLKLGKNTIVVIDRFAELPLLITASKKLGVKPRIGLRAKLNSPGAGKWVESSGAKSKFGLTPSEIVRAIELLKKEELLNSMELLHFHIGSQIPSIQSIKSSIKEAGRIYTELCSIGAKPKFIDVGGGLGVDYDGSGKSDSSTNYSEQEYANDVISIIQNICDEKGFPHPNIVSESGRALVAHGSMIVFDVLGSNEVTKESVGFEPIQSDIPVVQELFEMYETISKENVNEFFNDLIEKKNDILQMFTFGTITLEQRAKAEDLFWAISTKIYKLIKSDEEFQDIYWKLESELSDTYFCNFSVFQSLPDSWALGQVFPVMPIHRLDTAPKRRATLADLTCDSDGKIKTFIDTETNETQSYLEVHDLNNSEPYFLGVFLTGAYQEILGDLHNLFGDTDAVHISISDSGYSIEHVVHGDTVSEILGYLDYHRPELIERIRKSSEESILKGTLSPQEYKLLMNHYEQGLSGYTYLEDSE